MNAGSRPEGRPQQSAASTTTDIITRTPGTGIDRAVSPDPTRYQPLTEARFHAAFCRLVWVIEDDRLAIGPPVGDQEAVGAWLVDLVMANPALHQYLYTRVDEAGGLLPVKLTEDAVLTTVRHGGGSHG